MRVHPYSQNLNFYWHFLRIGPNNFTGSTERTVSSAPGILVLDNTLGIKIPLNSFLRTFLKEQLKNIFKDRDQTETGG